jgi:hypothetical protein
VPRIGFVVLVYFVVTLIHVLLLALIAAFLPIRSRQKTWLLVIVSCLVATPVVASSTSAVAVVPLWVAYTGGLDYFARTLRVAFRDTLWMVTVPGLLLTAATAFGVGQLLRRLPFNKGPRSESSAPADSPPY